MKMRITLTTGMMMAGIIISSLCTMSTTDLRAQAPFTDKSILAAEPTPAMQDITVSDFSVRTLDELVYVSFYVQSKLQNYTLLFQRSTNGSEYMVLDKRECTAPDDQSMPLLYSFTDTDPGMGTNYYRVLQVSTNFVAYTPTATVDILGEIPQIFYTEN